MKRIYIIVGLFIIFVASLVAGIIVIQKEERKIFSWKKLTFRHCESIHLMKVQLNPFI